MEKLKPCPFCGHYPVLFIRAGQMIAEPDQPEVYYVPICTVCSAALDRDFESRTEAIEAWNKRA